MLRNLGLLSGPAELGAAEAVLSRLGHRALGRDPGGQAVAHYARDGEPATVDLHREALLASRLLPAAEALRRARRAAAFGAPALAADPADEVLLRALHERAHHDAYRDGVVSLRALLDMAVRLPVLDAADWREARGRAKQARALTPLAAMLGLAGRVFGPSMLPPEAQALARGKLARAAAGRIWRKAERRLPAVADVVWGQAIGRLAGYGHRPAADGAFAAWWIRQCALGILHAPGWLRHHRTGRAGA